MSILSKIRAIGLFLIIVLLTASVIALWFRDPVVHQTAIANTVFDVKLQEKFINARATFYVALPDQDGPLLDLADGTKAVNDSDIYKHRYCAISRDMFEFFSYGDTILVRSDNPLISGLWIIHDTMHPRMKKTIDLLIAPDDLKYFPMGVYPVKISKY